LLQIMQTHATDTYWLKSDFRERWTSKRKALINTVSNIISAGVDEGAIRSDLSTDFLATSLLGMLRAYVRDSDTYSDSKQEGELLVDLFLNGVCKADNRPVAHCSELLQSIK